MTRPRVAFTVIAERQLDTIHAWWVVHRPAAAGLFLEEIRTALERIARTPSLGRPYPRSRVAGMRRTLLRRSGYHLYYRYDAERSQVEVRAIWHAARRAPKRISISD